MQAQWSLDTALAEAGVDLMSAYGSPGMTLWQAACHLGVGRKVVWPERDDEPGDRRAGRRAPPSGPPSSGQPSTLELRRRAAREGRKLTEDDLPQPVVPLGVQTAALGLAGT